MKAVGRAGAKRKDEVHPKEIQKLLAQIAGTPEEQALLIIADLLLTHSSPEMVFDNPVNLQIRISTDRRCKVTIIRAGQPKMPGALRAVFLL